MIRLRLSRVAIVAILILTPIPPGLRDLTDIHWEFIFKKRDAFANVLLYVPFGLFLQPTKTLGLITGLGAGMSALIEVAQLFFVGRSAQPADVVTNTVGALCGGLAGRFFRVQSDRIKLGPAIGLAAIATAVVSSSAYLSIWKIVPTFFGRGTTAAVAFLCAMGFTGILKPRSPLYRVAVGVLGGGTGATVLSRTHGTLTFLTLALGLVFGLALVLCTTVEPHST